MNEFIKNINIYNIPFFAIFIVSLYFGLFEHEYISLFFDISPENGYLAAWYTALMSGYLTILATPSALRPVKITTEE
jgi:hypothetical protein